MKAIYSVALLLMCSTAFSRTPSEDGPYRVTSKEKHEMRVINSGIGSLYARVDMIRRAKKSIDLETFIFNTDTTGKIILKELAEAAKRGVKVRLLVDKSPGFFKFNEHIAEELKKNNIEVRFYNPAPIYKVASVQFRNHRKLMVRDGEEALTGGRNISNEYHDLSTRFNFLDRDITVEGEVVKDMGMTFENYWNSTQAEIPKKPVPPEENPYQEGSDVDYQMRKADFDKKEKKAKDLFAKNDKVEKALKVLEDHGQKSFLALPKRTCPEVAFASDREGASFKESLNPQEYSSRYRILRKEIMKWMETKTKDEFILDTPYFLNNSITDKMVEYLQQKKVKIKLFTNSLVSTDAIHIAAVFNSSVTSYTPYEGFKAYVYKGKYSDEAPLHDEKVKDSVWGTHSKTMVFSNDAFMIGSFNVDHRSNHYNNELSVFCSGSPELTKDIKDNIDVRIKNSFKLGANGDGEDCDVNAEVGPVKTLLYYLMKIPAHYFQHLL